MRFPIAVIGLNYGRWIIDALHDSDGAGQYFQLAAVCDTDSARARAMGEKTGVRVATFEELLEDPEIPAIGLFTGPSGRSELIRRIIRAGKDVMTTKPFELNAKEAAAVLDEARALGRVMHLNSPAPLPSPDLVCIERWRELYRLGCPVGCRADTYATYFETADGSWYDDPERCPVAPVFRIGIYLINDLVHLFGRPVSVQVLASRIRTGRPTPDNAQAGILFENGALAAIFASLCVDDGQRWTDSLTLNFERGTIYRNVGPLAFGGGPEGDTMLRLLVVNGESRHSEEIRYGARSGQYRWDVFHRALSGEKIETPAAELVMALRVVEALARAEKSGATELVQTRLPRTDDSLEVSA